MLEGLKAYFSGTQTPEEAAQQAAKERALESQYGFSTMGVESPVVDPIDSLAGGVMMLPRGILAALSEAGSDALIGLAIDAQAEDEYLRAAFIGPKGIRAMGRDASKDLFGQWSALHDRNVRLEVQDPSLSRMLTRKEARGNEAYTLGELVSDDPDKVLDLYPELKNVTVKPTLKAGGYYDSRLKEMGVEGEIPGLSTQARDFRKQREIFTHETQHAIDAEEGFPRGGSPDENWDRVKRGLAMEYTSHPLRKEVEDALILAHKKPTKANKEAARIAEQKYAEIVRQANQNIRNIKSGEENAFDNYYRLAGEEQAFDTERRMGLSTEARRRIQPYSSYAAVGGELRPTYNQKPIPIEELIIDYRPTGKIQASVPGPYKVRNTWGDYDPLAQSDIIKSAKAVYREATKNNPERIEPYFNTTSLVRTDILDPYKEFNRRQTPSFGGKEELDNFVKQIGEEGVRDPLILTYYPKDNKVLLTEGNHRLVAAKENKIPYLPVRVYVSRNRSAPAKALPVRGKVFGENEHIPAELSPVDIGLPGVNLTDIHDQVLSGKIKRAPNSEPVQIEDIPLD